METVAAVEVGGRGCECRQRGGGGGRGKPFGIMYQVYTGHLRPAGSFLSLQEFPRDKGVAKEAVHKLYVT